MQHKEEEKIQKKTALFKVNHDGTVEIDLDTPRDSYINKNNKFKFRVKCQDFRFVDFGGIVKTFPDGEARVVEIESLGSNPYDSYEKACKDDNYVNAKAPNLSPEIADFVRDVKRRYDIDKDTKISANKFERIVELKYNISGNTFVYQGDLQDGKMHGKGKCMFLNGLLGKDFCLLPYGVIYDGDFENNQFIKGNIISIHTSTLDIAFKKDGKITEEKLLFVDIKENPKKIYNLSEYNDDFDIILTLLNFMPGNIEKLKDLDGINIIDKFEQKKQLDQTAHFGGCEGELLNQTAHFGGCEGELLNKSSVADQQEQLNTDKQSKDMIDESLLKSFEEGFNLIASQIGDDGEQLLKLDGGKTIKTNQETQGGKQEKKGGEEKAKGNDDWFMV